MQAELDEINKRLAEVDRELDEVQEGTQQYLVRENEYISIISITLRMLGSSSFCIHMYQILENEYDCLYNRCCFNAPESY